VKIAVRVNAQPIVLEARTDETLLVALRKAGLRSVRETCGIGVCGACTVVIDGMLMSSCLVLAPAAAGKEISTAEGLDESDPIAMAFDAATAFQCGYCTPGFVLTARALLAEIPDPSDAQIRHALAGNLCRCGSYVKIIQAVRLAARRKAAQA
jgi:aerobic-type carbon monoxide dehydrogenase small subunit (CoxS/CutS family)